MHGSLDAPPIIILQKRRWRLLALPAVMLAVVGLNMGAALSVKIVPSALYFELAVVLVLLALSAARFIWRSRLIIGADGVEVTGPLQRWRRPWRDIHDFRPVRWGGSELIGYDRVDGRPRGWALTRAFTRMHGIDGFLGANMEMGADDLAVLLNQARGRWAAEGPPPAVRAVAMPPRASLGSILIGFLAGRSDQPTYCLGMAAVTALAAGAGLASGRWIWSLGIGAVAAQLISASRMRDIGRSPAWFLVAILVPLLGVAIAVAVLAAFAPAAARLNAFWIGLGAVYVSEFAALGLIAGSPGTNRYGPPPLSRVKSIGEIFS